MIRLSRYALLPLALLATGCEHGSEERVAAEPLAVEYRGGGISVAELDALVGPDADMLQAELYRLRSAILEELLTERLVEAEAARRGMSAEQLLEVEIRQRVPEPTDEELEQYYRDYPERFEGDTREQAYVRITDALYTVRAKQARLALRERLRREAGVRVLIEPPRHEVSIPASAPSLGPEDAPVTIVEYTDYECPYCRGAQETIDALMERYEGKLRLVYRPLPQAIHPRAAAAARAAGCAREQGRFWDYHRDLLLEPDGLEDADLVARAQRLELDPEAFRACLASEREDPATTGVAPEAERLNVSATPTFFVNGRRLVGSRTIEEFAAVIDDELRRAESS
jgi:protein-disulfide isomerase